MENLELGRRAKDIITGFEGVLTAKCEFLTGCTRWCISPTELENGKPIDPIYFDEPLIELVGKGKMIVEIDKPGDCSPDPNK